MATDKYTKVGAPNLTEGVQCAVDVDIKSDLPSQTSDLEGAAKAALTQQGKHKGSVLYTRLDK